jgi:hypothetical protein
VKSPVPRAGDQKLIRYPVGHLLARSREVTGCYCSWMHGSIPSLRRAQRDHYADRYCSPISELTHQIPTNGSQDPARSGWPRAMPA